MRSIRGVLPHIARFSVNKEKTSFTRPWLWLSIITLSFIKIWIVTGQTLFAIDGRHDDRLFLNIADNLAHGKWLGDYNNLTLAKGMFYPLFVAAAYRIGVPLLLAQQMLYIFACLLLVMAVRPTVRPPLMLLFIFALLLFNPMSYDVGLATMVTREGIYPALALMVAGLTAGFMVRLHRPCRTPLWWSSGLGLAISAFWLTREEGVWILPFIFICAGFSMVRTWRTNPAYRLRLLYWALPLSICLLFSGIVAGLNKLHYGIFTTVEFKEPAFVSAYGALTRVKHTNWSPYVLVPRETRDRIYEASPSFSELRPFLEGDIGRQWSTPLNKRVINEQMEKDPFFAEKIKEYLRKNEDDLIVKLWVSEKARVFDGTQIPGGWFMWALRDAVAAAGHYSSGTAAADYYGRLAHEINIACNEGRLECYGKHATMMAPWHSEYNSYLKNSLIKGIRLLADFEEPDLLTQPGVISEESLTAFKRLTRERLSPAHVEIKGWAFGKDALRARMLEFIGRGYRFFAPFFSIAGISAFLIETIMVLMRRKAVSTQWIICAGLLISNLTLITILSLIHTTAFPAIPSYLGPSYPLHLLFTAMAFMALFKGNAAEDDS